MTRCEKQAAIVDIVLVPVGDGILLMQEGEVGKRGKCTSKPFAAKTVKTPLLAL